MSATRLSGPATNPTSNFFLIPALGHSGLGCYALSCFYTVLTAYASYAALRQALDSGQTTCRQQVEFYLHQISTHRQLNAFLETYPETALEQADAADIRLRAGTAGRLAGMVVGLKDLLCYKNHPVQAGSRILEGFRSAFSATAVERLLQEDAIIIGRQNCDEFGMGSANEHSAFGPVLNPADPERVPGGSSGGSAAAVAAGLCHASLGTDTGGSVRQPAALCGVVGLKPTYGRVPRWGLLAYASSFDTIGPITRSVADAALLLEVMAGPDGLDSTAATDVPAFVSPKKENKILRIGFLQEGLDGAVDDTIKKAFRAAIEKFRAAGHHVEPVQFKLLNYLLPTYYILTAAEVSSNLARYDGLRYGRRSENATSMEGLYKKSRTEGFGHEARKRILLGTFVLSADYYDAYYTKAQRVRRLIVQETEALLSRCDVLLMPTTPAPAGRIGEPQTDPLQEFLGDIFTVQANVTGLPALSVPAGISPGGLPAGLQLLARKFDEKTLFQAAYLLENQ